MSILYWSMAIPPDPRRPLTRAGHEGTMLWRPPLPQAPGASEEALVTTGDEPGPA